MMSLGIARRRLLAPAHAPVLLAPLHPAPCPRYFTTSVVALSPRIKIQLGVCWLQLICSSCAVFSYSPFFNSPDVKAPRPFRQSLVRTYATSPNNEPQQPPIVNSKKQRSWSRKWVVRFARTILAVALLLGGSVLYGKLSLLPPVCPRSSLLMCLCYTEGYTSRHPPAQLPHDPAKKTLVVLGNGWGSTSFLKGLDTEHWNVIVISPRNFFLFTPLLPSVTVGTVENRSIIQPTRYLTRHKKRAVEFYEGESTEVDPKLQTVTFIDNSSSTSQTVHYDALLYGVGAENGTFGIPGVSEHGNFLKEVWDAEKIRRRLMDCIEKATFAGQSEEEMKRLLHMVVVGGGPTGVEYAAELRDFLAEDLANWYPECVPHFSITLVEALPNILPMFSKQLIDYTSQTFKSSNIQVLTKTMVKEVDDKNIIAQNENKELTKIPYGILVWATGNTARPVTRKLMQSLGDVQNQKRGLVVDNHMRVKGAEGSIWSLGDCTATSYAPTAQAASQQGQYLARIFNQIAKVESLEDELKNTQEGKSDADTEYLVKQISRYSKLREFSYSHQGTLAYIGSERAIADVPFFNGNIASGGFITMLFWRSAYVSNLFSTRNRTLVLLDWIKVKIFGRDVSRE